MSKSQVIRYFMGFGFILGSGYFCIINDDLSALLTGLAAVGILGQLFWEIL